MLAMLQPIALLLIIVAGYLFKRNRLFGPRDYRIVQVALFDLVLPGAIVYSFAKNPHDISLLWLSAYGFIVALVPVIIIYLPAARSPNSTRAMRRRSPTRRPPTATPNAWPAARSRRRSHAASSARCRSTSTCS